VEEFYFNPLKSDRKSAGYENECMLERNRHYIRNIKIKSTDPREKPFMWTTV
jgi:hypothetical protein